MKNAAALVALAGALALSPGVERAVPDPFAGTRRNREALRKHFVKSWRWEEGRQRTAYRSKHTGLVYGTAAEALYAQGLVVWDGGKCATCGGRGWVRRP